MSLATDLLKRAGIKPEKPQHHMARVHGVLRFNGAWRPYAKGPKQTTYYLGDFDSIARATCARKLYLHWVKKGFRHKQIPRHQSTVPYAR